jgi:glycosyltransferase involved in cell wall biosynthesis
METIFVVERSQPLLDKINAFLAENAIPNMMVVFSNNKLGLSAARNLGIKQAKGKIIAFVDDDVVLYPDWAEEMIKSLENDPAIGVTGSAFPLWENESLKWLPEEFYWLISCTAWTGWKEQRIVRGAFGANMGFKREAFVDDCLFSSDTGYTGGSYHQPVSDDLEFSLRVRKRSKKNIIFSPRPRVWHQVGKQRLSLRFVAKRAHQVGCARQILKKHYAYELGPFEQENHVLKGMLRLLLGLPKELLTKPRLAWKKLSLISTVLISTAVGYFIPVSSYSLIKQKGSY